MIEIILERNRSEIVRRSEAKAAALPAVSHIDDTQSFLRNYWYRFRCITGRKMHKRVIRLPPRFFPPSLSLSLSLPLFPCVGLHQTAPLARGNWSNDAFKTLFSCRGQISSLFHAVFLAVIVNQRTRPNFRATLETIPAKLANRVHSLPPSPLPEQGGATEMIFSIRKHVWP